MVHRRVCIISCFSPVIPPLKGGADGNNCSFSLSIHLSAEMVDRFISCAVRGHHVRSLKREPRFRENTILCRVTEDFRLTLN